MWKFEKESWWIPGSGFASFGGVVLSPDDAITVVVYWSWMRLEQGCRIDCCPQSILLWSLNAVSVKEDFILSENG